MIISLKCHVSFIGGYFFNWLQKKSVIFLVDFFTSALSQIILISPSARNFGQNFILDKDWNPNSICFIHQLGGEEEAEVKTPVIY